MYVNLTDLDLTLIASEAAFANSLVRKRRYQLISQSLSLSPVQEKNDQKRYRSPSKSSAVFNSTAFAGSDMEMFSQFRQGSQNEIPRPVTLSNAPPIIQGIQLVPTRVLPNRLSSIFPFTVLNAVQSKCYHMVYGTNDNFVLSAPTGSGKTAVLELAICKLIAHVKDQQFKIVYQAPTKALCAERLNDWQKKFSSINLSCAQLTGDTGQDQLKDVQGAMIIITTPEKWDSVTRKWKDHLRLMKMIRLFLIDEVHILKDDRGATLEAVVSRMKSIKEDVRFIALSATIPNPDDVATWLGKNCNERALPAHMEAFGDEFRPVRLEKFVCGYPAGGINDFGFDKLLDSKYE